LNALPETGASRICADYPKNRGWKFKSSAPIAEEIRKIIPQLARAET